MSMYEQMKERMGTDLKSGDEIYLSANALKDIAKYNNDVPGMTDYLLLDFNGKEYYASIVSIRRKHIEKKWWQIFKRQESYAEGYTLRIL